MPVKCEGLQIRQSPKIPGYRLIEHCCYWWWDWITWRVSSDHTCSLWLMGIPVLVKHDLSVNKTLAVIVGSSANSYKIHWQNSCLADALFGTNTCTDWMWYGYNYWSCNIVYRSMGCISTSCKMSGTDGRLSFNDLEDWLFQPYITYRVWTANIWLHSMKCSHFSESAVNREESMMIWYS